MSKICNIEGCEKPFYGKNLCSMHYHRLRRHGDTSVGAAITNQGVVQEYYNSTVMNYDGNECLIWPFSRNGGGYGKMTVGGQTRIVSRVICAEFNGEPPTPEHEAAHSCGNGHLGCVAKSHLSWKTPSENRADKVIHGTSIRGEGNPKSKITEATALEIISLKGKERVQHISKAYGLSESAVFHLLSGRTWKHLERGAE